MVFHTVVMSGGATPTMSFFGCMQYLEHMGALPYVGTHVGSSAGAIVSLMMVLGFAPHEASMFVMEHGVQRLRVGELDLMDEMFGEWSCLETLGLDDGSRWVTFVEDAMDAKLGRRRATFRELAIATGKVFVVCVTNLTKARREYMSVDTEPDMSVGTAVRMSMSVPVLYTPVMYRGDVYVDGSVLDNFPLAAAAGGGRRAGGPPTTLALYMRAAPCPSTEAHEGEKVLPSPLEYVGMLIGAVMTNAQCNNGADIDSNLASHIVKVGVPLKGNEATTCGFDVRSMAFDVQPGAMREMVARGYIAARDALDVFFEAGVDMERAEPGR